MKVNPSVKLLQSQGLGSKKICEKILWETPLKVNGEPFDPETQQLKMGDRIEMQGLSFTATPFVYVMLNKPAGFETSHKPSAHPSVFSLLPPHYVARGVQAAGRLDQDTTGLLLFSDDGQFIHKLTGGSKGRKQGIEKIYEMECADAIAPELLSGLMQGVMLHDEPEPICASQVHQLDTKRLRMGITTGKYHQVKRMIAAAGNRVEQLHRTQVGPYLLPDDLAPGCWIEVDPKALV